MDRVLRDGPPNRTVTPLLLGESLCIALLVGVVEKDLKGALVIFTL